MILTVFVSIHQYHLMFDQKGMSSEHDIKTYNNLMKAEYYNYVENNQKKFLSQNSYL